jgi:hypothetical protein
VLFQRSRTTDDGASNPGGPSARGFVTRTDDNVSLNAAEPSGPPPGTDWGFRTRGVLTDLTLSLRYHARKRASGPYRGKFAVAAVEGVKIGAILKARHRVR